MSTHRFALRVALVLTLTGCELVDKSGYYRAAMAYESKDGVADAQMNAQKRDFRIYSAMGYGRYFPGLEPDVGYPLSGRFGTRSLSIGTSDDVSSSGQSWYRDAATKYAGAYNREMVAILQSLGMLSSHLTVRPSR